MTITNIQPELPRDRFGRPMVIPKTGGKPVPYTRCTTFVDCLEDKFNLQTWQQRMVATGLSHRADLLLAVSAAGDDKTKLDKLCEEAREAAAASAAATTGTALHALTEVIDKGNDLPPLPAESKADLEAYRKATEDLKAIHIEQFSVLDNFRIGGTSDRIVQVDGQLYIADIKTGSIQWGMGKIAMQLAVYAHSTGYDFNTNKRFDLGPINTDVGIIIHLPAGEAKCDLVPVDIAAGWKSVSLAYEVRQWRKKKNWTTDWPGDVLNMTEPTLTDRIAEAKTPDELATIWATHQDTWTQDLTDLASARKAELLKTA